MEISMPAEQNDGYGVLKTGAYKGRCIIDVCEELGFEKLYMQCIMSHAQGHNSSYRKINKFDWAVKDFLYTTLRWKP